ncbi:MAG TPA: transglycosylase SLT domain-containing protein, partial [Pseudomonadales bacterium]|nr:transglycosylase SLT domain-containing protein [Pseudomonadales bacterium]
MFQTGVVKLALLLLLGMLAGCTTSPPTNPNNLCSIFEEKSDWYEAAQKSEQKWGSPIPVMMAIMRHESGFVADARPPRMRILWIIPGPRPSNAYGYPQALNDTWDWYKSDSGNWGADRDDFDDAIDFMGWYNHQTLVRNNVKLNDTYNLYLAYHEGQKGYQLGTYRGKTWLKNTASAVAQR